MAYISANGATALGVVISIVCLIGFLATTHIKTDNKNCDGEIMIFSGEDSEHVALGLRVDIPVEELITREQIKLKTTNKIGMSSNVDKN